MKTVARGFIAPRHPMFSYQTDDGEEILVATRDVLGRYHVMDGANEVFSDEVELAAFVRSIAGEAE